MPGVHKMPTIAFRPNSGWELALIEERAALSGMHKKNFISRSCIYSNICVVGKKENIQKIVDAANEVQITMREIVRQLKSGDFSMSEEGFEDVRNDVLAIAVTLVDILNGAAYLFDKEPKQDNQHWKRDLEVEQLGEALR